MDNSNISTNVLEELLTSFLSAATASSGNLEEHENSESPNSTMGSTQNFDNLPSYMRRTRALRMHRYRNEYTTMYPGITVRLYFLKQGWGEIKRGVYTGYFHQG